MLAETNYRPLEKDNRLEAWPCWHCDSPESCTLSHYNTYTITDFISLKIKNKMNNNDSKKHRPVFSGAATHLQTPTVLAGTATVWALRNSNVCLAAKLKKKKKGNWKGAVADSNLEVLDLKSKAVWAKKADEDDAIEAWLSAIVLVWDGAANTFISAFLLQWGVRLLLKTQRFDRDLCFGKGRGGYFCPIKKYLGDNWFFF